MYVSMIAAEKVQASGKGFTYTAIENYGYFLLVVTATQNTQAVTFPATYRGQSSVCCHGC